MVERGSSACEREAETVLLLSCCVQACLENQQLVFAYLLAYKMVFLCRLLSQVRMQKAGLAECESLQGLTDLVCLAEHEM